MDQRQQINSQLTRIDNEIAKLEDDIANLNSQLIDNPSKQPTEPRNTHTYTHNHYRSNHQYNQHKRYDNRQNINITYNPRQYNTPPMKRQTIALEDLKIDKIAQLCDDKNISRQGVPYRKNDLIMLLHEHGIYRV